MTRDSLRDHLLQLLQDLDGVQQNPRHHPEGDALYHSLQVFGVAQREHDDPELWAAALLHDVGKAVDRATHAEVGATELEEWLSSRVVWLVRHHMDLVHHPQYTRRRLRGRVELRDLERLRRWDLAGRSVYARVESPERAVEALLNALTPLSFARDFVAEDHETEDLF